jgi:aryl-alcohol dehydrogenase-like predicted oxidoreductase
LVSGSGRRKEIFLATKFGIILDPKTGTIDARGDREYVRQCIEGSLKRLGTDYVDLYYQHRIDKNTRIEDTVSAMAELVKEGKVKYLGLSECSSKTLQRAHKVHPIAAVQIEYSLFSLDIEREEIGLKKACVDLGVAIVAYSPLGRGILGGQIKSRSDLRPDDARLYLPRFSEENFPKNLEIVDKINQLAKKKGCTPGQLALAWLMKQGKNVIPIPGTRQLKYLEENLGSLKVNLTKKETQELRELAEKAEVKGERYPASALSGCFADTI